MNTWLGKRCFKLALLLSLPRKLTAKTLKNDGYLEDDPPFFSKCSLFNSHSFIFMGGMSALRFLLRIPESGLGILVILSGQRIFLMWFFVFIVETDKPQMVEKKFRLVNSVGIFSLINDQCIYYHYCQKKYSWLRVFFSIHFVFVVACCIASHSQVVQVPEPFAIFVGWVILRLIPWHQGPRYVWLRWPGRTGGNDAPTPVAKEVAPKG